MPFGSSPATNSEDQNRNIFMKTKRQSLRLYSWKALITSGFNPHSGHDLKEVFGVMYENQELTEKEAYQIAKKISKIMKCKIIINRTKPRLR